MRGQQLASCGTRKHLLDGLPANEVTASGFAGGHGLPILILFVLSLLFGALVTPLCAQAPKGIGSDQLNKDATSVTAAPDPGTLRLDYVGTDLDIHETSLSGGTWQDSNLTSLSGGPEAASDTSIADLVDTIQNVTRVSYEGADSHVHQLSFSSGTWHDSDLTAATGAPRPADGTAIATVLDTIENFVRVHYVAVDLHVHELYNAGGSWHDFDLTAATGGPLVLRGQPIANVVDTIANMLRVDYVAEDSHVHEFYIVNGSWHDYDLTVATQAPDVLIATGIADMIDTIQNVIRVHYVGADVHVHEFFISGDAWHDFDLTAATGAPEAGVLTSIANVIDTTQNMIRVDYGGGSSDVHEFYIANGAWYDFDLTASAQGPRAAEGTPIASIPDTIQNVMRVHYVDNRSHLHELNISGGAWHDDDLTAMTGGPPVEPLTSIANALDLLH